MLGQERGRTENEEGKRHLRGGDCRRKVEGKRGGETFVVTGGGDVISRGGGGIIALV